MSTHHLTGRVAVVTGGSSGIGEAISHRFASEGAQVVVSSRNLVECKRVAEDIRERGGVAEPFSCDVRSEDDVANLFAHANATFGDVTVLVANAGISGGTTRIADYPPDRWREVIETNLTGVFLTCREGFSRMETTGGHIILMGSQAGVTGYAGKGVYCASKFGVRGLGHVLAEEGRKFGINVSVLGPGTVQTPILAATGTSVKNPLHLDAVTDAAVYLATLRGNSMVRDVVLERRELG